MEENEFLKARIDKLENQSRNEDKEREKFYEGAVWSSK
jgi:hypothetical protein